MRIAALWIYAFVITGISLLSCSKDKVPVAVSAENCPDTISYETQIRPLVEQNCSTSGCHDASASGGYTLTSYEQISNNAEVMLQTMNHDSGVKPMPDGGSKLQDSLIQQMRCWIAQGKNMN